MLAMNRATDTANENKAAAEPAKGTSTPKEPPPRAALAPTKSDSEDEDEVSADHRRSPVSYYRKLKLPTGEKVSITKRNQFIRAWTEKRLKCDARPYYMLGAATVLLLLLLYVYAYHQVGKRSRPLAITLGGKQSNAVETTTSWCCALIYNLFGRPGEQASSANQGSTLSNTGNDESTDATRRAPCPQHHCSPSYAGSPATQRGSVPCPVHDVTSRDSDKYDNSEYGHDPLFFYPQRRVIVHSSEGRANQQHETKKFKYENLYDSYIHERRLRDQWDSPMTRGQQLPKSVGPARTSVPTFARRQAATSKEKGGTSARRPSAPTYGQPRDKTPGHRGDWQQQQPISPWKPPIHGPSSTSKPTRRGSLVPAPKSAKNQARASAQADPSPAAQLRARVPSAPAANIVQGRTKPVQAAARIETSVEHERAIEKNHRARASNSKPERPDTSQIREKKSTKKNKKKKEHDRDAIIVSTPTGPFSPGTKAVKKSQKALKKAQELWQYSQLVGTFCLIFEIVGTIAILLVAMYWLIPRPDEEPAPKVHYGDDYGDQAPPFVPTRILHDGEGNDERPEQLRMAVG